MKYSFKILAVVLLFCAIGFRPAFAGPRYPNLNTPPLLQQSALEVVAELPEPPGNIAVTKEGRVFFTIHPESNPENVKLYELKNGKTIPFPDELFQKKFKTVLGLALDGQNRLWVIDHGGNGFKKPKIFAFDLATGNVVHEYAFPRKAGQIGSYFNDLRVSPDGKTAYIADISFIRKNPAIVVYDTETGKTRRLLEKDPSVSPLRWTVRHDNKELKVLAFMKIRLGVDGIALDSRGEWLYYAPMNQDAVFRIKTSALLDSKLSPAELSKQVERYGKKPFCDGIEMDSKDNLYITDIEHGTLFMLNPQRKLKTLITSKKIRWPDGMSASGNGYLYFTDSALSEILFKNKKKILQAGPFYIYRVKLKVGS